MKNIGIIVDSTTLLKKEHKNHPDVHVVSLAVVVNGEHFLDGKDIKEKDWLHHLQNDATMTTSQPSIADTIDSLELVKSKNYDHVFVLALTQHLSGTHDGFHTAQKEIQCDNLTIYDTLSIAGPIGYMVEVLLKMAQDDRSHQEMIQALDDIKNHSQTLIYPASLKRLIKSGRMSKTVGGIASVLKLKPLLILKNKGKEIEKLEVVRTEKKVIQTMINNLKEFGVNEDWILYLLMVNPVEFYDKMSESIHQEFGEGIEIRNEFLPGVIATHVGLDVFGIQPVKKVKE